MRSLTLPGKGTAGKAALRIGFIPLTDAAPLVAARELGYFTAAGLAVELSREVGWATIREKIIYGELDAAHALAPMLWEIALGIGCTPRPVMTALALNLHGNAITLSKRIGADEIRQYVRVRTGEKRATFGIVYPFSSHNVMLRNWLRSAGVDPDNEARLVVVPPAQMFRNFAAATIDGYCVGEPWNSLAVQDGLGWCPAWSASYAPGQVEKVLMVSEAFEAERPRAHLALVKATAAAAAWCDEPQNREQLAEILSSPRYLNTPASTILPALTGRFDAGRGQIENVPDFHVFSGGDAGAPTIERARSIQRDLEREGMLPAGIDPALPGRLFRHDLFRKACEHQTNETVTSSL